MWAVRNFQRHCFKAISLLPNRYGRSNLLQDVSMHLQGSNVIKSRPASEGSFTKVLQFGCINGFRLMSTTKGRSMRSKVEKRMRRETGKTLREIRRAKKIRKKLMTDEERLIYSLRKAKKKVALLLQKLKKYELPELPPPRHDPELLTLEQLQAYKKIGFRNRNYVPVGVRGVFGGVVQNMHLHWKFHETVQVCCDNFPKEKIKEMATMLARLSGGIVVNVHDVKTIIMFRGRNYRQPKNLIPINTLTKRKALFKARFEQALESQKLNIKKIEQQLRRMGVNPEDPVAMASIQRVASTFFHAIDAKQGTPYVFHDDKQPVTNPDTQEDSAHSEDIDQEEQEELDRFIAEIEDSADREWAAEEAAEKEDLGKIRYLNRDETGPRGRRFLMSGSGDSEDENRSGGRDRHVVHGKPRARRKWDSGADNTSDEGWDSDDMRSASDLESDLDGSNDGFRVSGTVNRRAEKRHSKYDRDPVSSNNRWREMNDRLRESTEEDSGPDVRVGDSDDGLWESDSEGKHDTRAPSGRHDFDFNYHSGSDSDSESVSSEKKDLNVKTMRTKTQVDETWDSN